MGKDMLSNEFTLWPTPWLGAILELCLSVKFTWINFCVIFYVNAVLIENILEDISIV